MDELIDATIAMFTSVGILIVILISALVTFLPVVPYSILALKAPISCNVQSTLSMIPFLYVVQSGTLFAAITCGETASVLSYFLINTVAILVFAILIGAFFDFEVPSFSEFLSR